MFPLKRVLLLAAAVGHARGQEDVAQGCGPVSFSQMGEMAQAALASVNTIGALKSRFMRSASAQLMCKSMDSVAVDDSTVPQSSTDAACLGQAFTASLQSQCSKTPSCNERMASAKRTMFQACDKLDKLGCTPKLCGRLHGGSAPAQPVALGSTGTSANDALIGCFDVHSSEEAAEALRKVFAEPSGKKVDSLSECATMCADSITFAMEDGRCSCGDGIMAMWPGYNVDPSECGKACSDDRDADLDLPCGRSERVAIYKTDSVAQLFKQLAPSMRAEVSSRVQHQGWSSGLLAAAGLGLAVVAVANIVRTVSTPGAQPAAQGQALPLV